MNMKKYLLGIPLFNSIVTILVLLDRQFYHIYLLPNPNAAPTTIITPFLIILFDGGYFVVGIIYGVRFSRNLAAINTFNIFTYTLLTFLIGAVSMLIHLPLFWPAYWFAPASEQAIGFFLGSLLGKKIKKKPSK